jgi:hypothetical protein
MYLNHVSTTFQCYRLVRYGETWESLRIYTSDPRVLPYSLALASFYFLMSHQRPLFRGICFR